MPDPWDENVIAPNLQFLAELRIGDKLGVNYASGRFYKYRKGFFTQSLPRRLSGDSVRKYGDFRMPLIKVFERAIGMPQIGDGVIADALTGLGRLRQSYDRSRSAKREIVADVIGEIHLIVGAAKNYVNERPRIKRYYGELTYSFPPTLAEQVDYRVRQGLVWSWIRRKLISRKDSYAVGKHGLQADHKFHAWTDAGYDRMNKKFDKVSNHRFLRRAPSNLDRAEQRLQSNPIYAQDILLSQLARGNRGCFRARMIDEMEHALNDRPRCFEIIIITDTKEAGHSHGVSTGDGYHFFDAEFGEFHFWDDQTFQDFLDELLFDRFGDYDWTWELYAHYAVHE
jgi:hypothetical protein